MNSIITSKVSFACIQQFQLYFHFGKHSLKSADSSVLNTYLYTAWNHQWYKNGALSTGISFYWKGRSPRGPAKTSRGVMCHVFCHEVSQNQWEVWRRIVMVKLSVFPQFSSHLRLTFKNAEVKHIVDSLTKWKKLLISTDFKLLRIWHASVATFFARIVASFRRYNRTPMFQRQ